MAQYTRDMGLEAYSLQELADATGIEPRTIRSYVERGLVSGPEVRGRHSAYSREVLDRLRVLNLLRDARRDISLDQIRRLLAQLSPAQVRGMAEGTIRIGGIVGAAEPGWTDSSGSAMESLRRIRESTGTRSMQPASVAAGKASAERVGSMAMRPDDGADLTPLDRLASALASVSASGAGTRSVRSETWHRVAITPDIELSIRGELSAEQMATLHRIGDLMRVLIMKR